MRLRRLVRVTFILLAAIFLFAGGILTGGLLAVDHFRKTVLPQQAEEWLVYAEMVRKTSASHIAPGLEEMFYRNMGPSLRTTKVKSVEDMSQKQKEALVLFKGYADRENLVNESLNPYRKLVFDLAEQVPWSDGDIARRQFAAKYKTEEPAKAPSLHEVKWIVNADTEPVLDGKVVLVDFWGLRCGPCLASMPHLQNLWNKYSNEGLLILSLHCQKKDDNQIRSLFSENGYSFPVGQVNSSLTKKFYVQALPSYYIIDRKGRLVIGPEHEVPAEERIIALLKERQAEENKL